MNRVKEEIVNDVDDDVNHNHNNIITLPSSSSSSSSQSNYHSTIIIKKEEDREGCTIHHNNHLEFINCENCRKVSQCPKTDDDDDKTKIALTCALKRECIKSEYDKDCGCNDCLHSKNVTAPTSTSFFAVTENHKVNDPVNSNDSNQEQESQNQQRENVDTDYHDDSCPTPDYIPPFFPDDENGDDDEDDSSSSNEKENEISNKHQQKATTSHHSSVSPSLSDDEAVNHNQNDFAFAEELNSRLNRRRSTRSVTRKPKTYVFQYNDDDDDDEASRPDEKKESDYERSPFEDSDDAEDVPEEQRQEESSLSSSSEESDEPKTATTKRTSTSRKTKSKVPMKSKMKKPLNRSNRANNLDNDGENDGSQSEVEEENTKRTLQSLIEVARLKCWLCDHSAENKKKLNEHLLENHKLEQYRCLMHECGFSTHHNVALTNHFKTAHDGLTNWPCAQCTQKPNSYAKLVIHFKHFHQQGTFRCDFKECDFTPTSSRRDVKNHLAAMHRCPVVSCARLLPRDALKKHLSIAHSIKAKRKQVRQREQFHCRWNSCIYRSEKPENVLVHVQNSHLNNDDDNRDPGEYVGKLKPTGKSQDDEPSTEKEDECDDDEMDNEDDKKESNIRSIVISLSCWLCKRVNRSFKDKFELNDHLLEVHKVEQFRCVAWRCGASFPYRDQLYHHKQAVHKSTRIWACDQCKPPHHGKRYFTSYELLAIHKMDMHRTGHFKCAVKGCTFANIGNESEDENTSSESDSQPSETTKMEANNKAVKRKSGASVSGKPTKKPKSSNDFPKIKPKRSKNASILTVRLNCPIDGCTEHRKNKFELNAHLLEGHQLEQHRCVIQDCTANFKYTLQYTEHLKKDHANIDRYNCSKCDYSAKGIEALNVHTYTYHDEGEFRCSQPGCDFVSHTSRQKVQGHQYRHKPLRYKCTHTGCEQAFREPKSLKNHLKNHETGMFEGCPHCGRHFARLDLFKKHLKIHSKTKAKQQDGFECGWKGCKYFVSQRAQLKPHLVEQHFVGHAKYGKISDKLEMIRAVKSFTKVIRAKK